MTTLTTVDQQIKRDHWGRPLVIPPGGGKPVPYTRASSFDVCEDTYTLNKWSQRMVALGLADRPDLVLAAAAHRDDKKKINDICKQASEAAKSSAAATTGTALHALTEQIDRGEDPIVPEAVKGDIEAYREATSILSVESVEVFGVCDEVQAAGTWDRIVSWEGQRFVADLKTGSSMKYGQLRIAQQLAIYANSAIYDPLTGDRTPTGVYKNAGIIIHLPAGEQHCELIWFDLKTGWQIVKLSHEVRQIRSCGSKLTRGWK